MIEFNSFDFLSFFIKTFGIVLGFLYMGFTFILVKQVDTLKKTIIIPDKDLFLYIGLIQFVFSGIIVIYAIFIL